MIIKNKKNNIIRLIFLVLVMTVVILCIEFYHLNTGIMRNLSSNLNEIKHGIQQIKMLTEDNDYNKMTGQMQVKVYASETFVAIRNVNYVAEKSFLYKGYSMPKAEGLFLRLMTSPDILEKQEIRDLLIKSAETLEFDLSGENGSRYNLLTDRADIKSMIKEFEENL